MSSLFMQVYLLQPKCSFRVKSKAQNYFFLGTVSLGDLRSGELQLHHSKWTFVPVKVLRRGSKQKLLLL